MDRAEFELLKLLKETIRAQEVMIAKQGVQLQEELLSFAAVNGMLETENAELKTRVEKYERMLLQKTPAIDP
jgi:hypothetical protein